MACSTAAWTQAVLKSSPMKTTLCCPKCAHGKIWKVDHVSLQRDAGGDNHPLPILAGLHTMSNAEALQHFCEPGQTLVREFGRFSAYVCAQCGYTEWYGTDLQELAVAARKAVNGVHLLERDSSSPYR